MTDSNTATATYTIKLPGQEFTQVEDQVPLWILVPIIVGIVGAIGTFVYIKKRKPEDKRLGHAEPMLAETRETELEVESTPQKIKELPKLNAKCADTIALLTSFIEDPSPTNDRNAWRGFKDFIRITEQIEDEYNELIEIRNRLAVLRRERDEYEKAGLTDLANKTEGTIQKNYEETIRVIKEIQKKLPQLGN